MSDSLWNHSYDDLYKATRLIGSDEDMTPDQLLKVAEVKALLAIGQELSALNPANTITNEKDESKPAPRMPKRIY